LLICPVLLKEPDAATIGGIQGRLGGRRMAATISGRA
jgi:hypothetical protein